MVELEGAVQASKPRPCCVPLPAGTAWVAVAHESATANTETEYRIERIGRSPSGEWMKAGRGMRAAVAGNANAQSQGASGFSLARGPGERAGIVLALER